MPTYFVKGPGQVAHNGTTYEVGEEVKDLSAKEAQSLVDAGAVTENQEESAPAAPADTPAATTQPTDEEVAAAAAAAGGDDKKGGIFHRG